MALDILTWNQVVLLPKLLFGWAKYLLDGGKSYRPITTS